MRLITFGEIMLRLSPPGRELLLQRPQLDIWVAGAEANVATALVMLDHDVRFVSRVPDSDLGRAAVARLRGAGVDTRGIRYGGDRLGLYFVIAGAGLRATEVLYDREHSAFAEAQADEWDWPALLQGADRLHLSGITPALSEEAARAAVDAARAANAAGMLVSFDGNYRQKLWERRGVDPRPILRGLVAEADLLFGNHRDLALLLAEDFGGEGEPRLREAALAAFDAFPRLRTIASTARRVEHADLHRLAARVETRSEVAQTEEIVLAGIVDRIGAGDAFAAGVLHALDGGIQAAARSGLALAALKHSLPGDAALFRQADIDAYLAGGLDVRR